MAVRARGKDIPSEPKSSGEDEEEKEEEGKVTPPPLSPPRRNLPSNGDIFHRHAGVILNACRLKWTWIETRPSTSSPPQPRLALVSPASRGSSIMLVLMEPTHLFGISCHGRNSGAVLIESRGDGAPA
jgi:hypothetical protein